MERNIRRTLRDNGLEPTSILTALGETRSLISGLLPVAALFPGRFKPNDVDIYCPEEEEGYMLHILQNRMGFHLHKGVDVRYPKHSTITKIYWLTTKSAKVNLMVVKGNNAAIAIFQFHSTIVMNILCFHGLYCTYADLTLAGERLINSSYLHDGARAVKCIEKYEDRGFTFKKKLGDYERYADHECGENASCPTTVRTLHDGHSIFYPLKVHLTGGTRPAMATKYTSFDGKHSVVWSLGGPLCGLGTTYHSAFATSIELHNKTEEGGETDA
ncbi:hypothetical protein C8F04DRAFT_1324382 [Mycena alexandri]|uniref:Uncharacterized protein n=1 Tax=Mycena alexandri TaxID=1745969 RepID=A0AAD6X4C8_9AGAR|nr:hypothetical protein C8F04DRAFT_1324382 [Mycena alexandri]